MSDTEDADAIRAKFARALIALAREHGVGSVSCTFSLNGDKNWQKPGIWDATNTSVSWSEGRHAAAGNISLAYEMCLNVKEDEQP